MRTILTLVAATGLLAGGCSRDAGADPDGRVAVVTSFYPLRFLAERVGGGCVAVTNLTPPGAEPHDLELTPDGIEAIATADVVLFLGGGFQPSVEDAIGEAHGTVIDVLELVDTEPASADDVGEGLTRDPHVWLDPERLSLVVDPVAEAIVSAGASDCEVDVGARDLIRQLDELDDTFHRELADCELDVLVTTHAAFGYLADAYGLRQEAIAGLEPDVEPSPSRLAELTTFVRAAGVTTVFTEELVSPDVARALAAEADVETAVLSTVEGLTEEQIDAGEDYRTLMEANLDALRTALRCA